MTEKPRTIETFPGDSRLFECPDGVQISVITLADHVEAHCHGPVEHFREDGGCPHMDEMLSAQKPGRDVRALPFGGRTS